MRTNNGGSPARIRSTLSIDAAGNASITSAVWATRCRSRLSGGGGSGSCSPLYSAKPARHSALVLEVRLSPCRLKPPLLVRNHDERDYRP